ncbi:unnamed protein product [Linum tenue]|uniref:Uncharacterized protein n=1 Tax=Linum tenue TaxID=586396 RepID=A0AAV0JA79_9ROSI|nr:unnamed protein product [Linum tenue]
MKNPPTCAFRLSAIQLRRCHFSSLRLQISEIGDAAASLPRKEGVRRLVV